MKRAHRLPFVRSLLLFSVLLSSIEPYAFADQHSELEKQLRAQWVNKVLFIRNFYKGKRLKFDKTGKLVTKAELGYWTVDGMVEVDNVKVAPERVREH